MHQHMFFSVVIEVFTPSVSEISVTIDFIVAVLQTISKTLFIKN